MNPKKGHALLMKYQFIIYFLIFSIKTRNAWYNPTTTTQGNMIFCCITNIILSYDTKGGVIIFMKWDTKIIIFRSFLLLDYVMKWKRINNKNEKNKIIYVYELWKAKLILRRDLFIKKIRNKKKTFKQINKPAFVVVYYDDIKNLMNYCLFSFKMISWEQIFVHIVSIDLFYTFHVENIRRLHD